MLRLSRASSHGGRKLAPYLLVIAASAAWPATAVAGGFSVEIDHGLSVPLSRPLSRMYSSGLGEELTARFGVSRYLDLGPALTYMYLPTQALSGSSGAAWGFGGGARVLRPHDATSYGGISPWLSFDALYVRTGPLNRPGFDVATGLGIPLDKRGAYWFGPFVRYSHTHQPAREGFDNTDAKVLIFGLSLEVGTARKQPGPTASPSHTLDGDK